MPMTNKEKKEYLNLLIVYKGKPFISEVVKKEEFLNRIPKKLFKFRKFDDFTFDMLENEYVYLAPAGNLDDPFDCLTNINLERVYKKGTFKLSNNIVSKIIDAVSSHMNSKSINKRDLIKIFNACSKGEHVDEKLLSDELLKVGYLTEQERDTFYKVIINFPSVINILTETDDLKKLFIQLKNAKNTIGVCSLTTKRDNKVMWSLYGDTYKGYCVEYEEIKEPNILKCLKPVVYSKRTDNDIILTIIKFSIETLLRFVSNGKIPTNIGVFDELTCSKDSDWSFQDEWRIIANPNLKAKIKAKAVYLGFDVTTENQERMVQCAKHKGFSLFKMKPPKNTKKIEYEKLV